MRVLGRYAEWIYGLMRIVVGFLFACHGMQKIFGAFGGQAIPPGGTEMYIAGLIELIAGALIMVGLFAGIAAFIASGEMAVAYFQAHAPGGPLPIENHGEAAVLYCFIFLFIAAKGSGALSLDGLFRKSSKA
jgi:putative oxidoreductase